MVASRSAPTETIPTATLVNSSIILMSSLASVGSLSYERMFDVSVFHGRARHSTRVHDAVPKNFGRNVTIPGALCCNGLDAVMTVDGATDTAVFRTCITQVLVPTLVLDDMVIMDNLSSHKVSGIEEAIKATGASLLFLPPYCPDCSPIENCWSELVPILRQMKARMRDALDDALKYAIDRITGSDAKGWFRHRGYAVHQFANCSSTAASRP